MQLNTTTNSNNGHITEDYHFGWAPKLKIRYVPRKSYLNPTKKKTSFWWGLSLTIRYDFWNLASTSQIWAPLKNIFFRGAQGPKVEE